MIPVSLLSAYLYCPRKVYLQNVLKFSEPTRESTLKGTVKHMVFSAFTERESSVVSSIRPEHSFGDIKKLYEGVFEQELKNVIIQKKRAILRLRMEPDDFYHKVWPVFEADLDSRVKALWDFIQQEKKYGRELWESLTPKTKSEYSIESESLGLNGSVDQVLVYTNGIVPLEIKSSKPPEEGLWPGHKIQLAAYMVLLGDKFQTEIKKGIIYYLGEEFRDLYMNPFLKNDVLKTKDLVNKLLNSTNLPPIPKKENRCNRCGLRKHCHDEDYIAQLQQKTLNTT